MYKKYKTDYLYHFSRVLNKVLVEPEMIQIMLTSRCNIRCQICDVWKQDYKEEMTTDEVKYLIDQAIAMGIKTIYMTGGEALLHKDILELINHAARPGINVTVNTNGSFITDAFARQIVSSKLTNINFSIDGVRPRTHNINRGPEIFEKAVKAVRLINHYKKLFKRDHSDPEENMLHVTLSSVITKMNMGELPHLVRLAKHLQCRHISFQPLVYNGNLLESLNLENEFCIEEDDIPELQKSFKKLEQMKKNGRFGVGVDVMPLKTIQHFRKQRSVNSCFAGFTRIFVNPDGDIGFVCFPSLGNIRTGSLEETWLSPKAFETRAQLKSCTVNCTQFCSERTASDDIEEIHSRFQRELEHCGESERKALEEENRSFLRSMEAMVRSEEIPAEEKERTLRALERVLESTGRGAILRPAHLPFDMFYIAMSDRCNLSCVMCSTTKHPGEYDKEMAKAELPLEQWEAVIDNIMRFPIRVISFGGGEPLLQLQNLAVLVPKIASRGVKVHIVTNGTLLTEDFLKVLSPYREKIHFILSLDGLKKEMDAIRGPGVFKKIMSAAKLLRRKRWRFVFSSVLMPQNFFGFIDFLKFLLREFPGIALDIQPLIPHNEIYYIRRRFELSKEHLDALRGILTYLHRECVDKSRTVASVETSTFSPFISDVVPLWEMLIRNGYIDKAGEILDRFGEVPDAASLILDPSFEEKRNEIFQVMREVFRDREKLKIERPFKLIDLYWDYFNNTLRTNNQCRMGTKSFNINRRGNLWICGKEIEQPLYLHKIEDIMALPEYDLEMKRVENCTSPCFAGLVI